MRGFIIIVVTFLSGCSAYGPGFAGHPLDCAIGIPWGDCAPGTPGYNNVHRQVVVAQPTPTVNITNIINK